MGTRPVAERNLRGAGADGPPAAALMPPTPGTATMAG